MSCNSKKKFKKTLDKQKTLCYNKVVSEREKRISLKPKIFKKEVLSNGKDDERKGT